MTVLGFDCLQRSDCGDVIGVLGFLPAFAQMIIRDMEVFCAGNRHLCRCFLFFFMLLILVIPIIPGQEYFKAFPAFYPKDRVRD